jgi:hypothetical protein
MIHECLALLFNAFMLLLEGFIFMPMLAALLVAIQEAPPSSGNEFLLHSQALASQSLGGDMA